MLSRNSRSLLAIASLPVLAAALAVVLRRGEGPPLEVVTLKGRADESAGLCPWRDPSGDLKRFFPGATGYRTELLALSRKRAEILKRLGPGASIRSNAFYYYPVERAGAIAGSVLVERAAGRYGAIEVV